MLADQERYPEALHHFDESYALYKSLNNQLRIGYSLINRGDLLWRLGRYQDAQAALSQASSIAERPDDRNRQMIARLSLISAYLALSERHFSETKMEGQQALALNAEIAHAAEAKYVLGLAQSLSGAKREGRLTCEKAVAMATHAGDPRIISRAMLALAEALLVDGDAQGALSTALQAQERFKRSGQQESEWCAWLIAGRACHRMGDKATAREYALHAESLLSELQQKWGTAVYQGYLARPDVQYSRRHLRQMLAVNE